ncbi:MAG: hypothetical protein ACRC7N_10420 [Clostridium sp.]
MQKELNLIPRSYETVKTQSKKTNSIVIAVLVLAVSIGGSFGFVTVREMLLEKQKTELQDELNKSMALIKKDQELQEQINLTKQHIEKVKELEVVKLNDTDKKLKDFFAFFTEGTFSLKTISYDITTIKFEGISKDKTAIQKAFASLREDEGFFDCHLTGYNEDKGEYTFTVEVALHGGDKK